jgi:hypothetical protein
VKFPSTSSAPPGRRGSRLLVVLALGCSGVVAVASPASADTGSIPTTLHGSGSLGSETATGSSGALSGSITASASLDWTQAAAVGITWDPDDVRQGRHLDPSVDYDRTLPGSMSIKYSVSGSASLDASSVGLGSLSLGFGPLSITAGGTCDLKSGGGNYTCHLESGGVDLFDLGPAALGTPYLHGKMVADVTVTPERLASLRTASAAGQTLGTNDLLLPEDALVDPLLVSCTTGAGDGLTYALGAFSATPGLHIVSGVELSAGAIVPNPVTAVPGIYVELASQTRTVATTDMGLTLTGGGGSITMGAVKPNNIAPTLGAVTVSPDAVEGTAVEFASSATGPCAAGGTYSWDFGDGSGPGHSATPQHTYADDGHWTGQVVFTDRTGLTDRADFAVEVANAKPGLTVIPSAPVTVAWGKPLTLQAQPVDPGSADQATLTYDWTFGDGDSVTNGGPSATHSWTSVGDRTPAVTVCDKDGGCTSKSFTVHVRDHATTLSYTGPQAATFSGTSTLTASLEDEFGKPVNNAPVVFRVDGSPVGTASTNVNGNASLTYVVTDTAGTHDVSAAYAGSPLYAGDTTGNAPFVVAAMPSKITYTGGLKGAPNKPTAISAKVVDALGRPLAGQTVTIVIGSQSKTAVTDGNGIAATTITLTQKPGYYPLTASWAGVAGKYLGDSAAAQFSLNKK